MGINGTGGTGKTGNIPTTQSSKRTVSLRKKPSSNDINPFASAKEKSEPLLDRKEDNVLGNLFQEEKPKTDPSQMQMVVRQDTPPVPETRFTLVNDKKPESDPSQMQMVVSQYQPSNMQMVVAQPQTQAPKKQGFFSRLKDSFKSGLAKGMKMAGQALSFVGKKLQDSSTNLQASVEAGKTIKENDVQVINKEFKNFDSVVRVTQNEIKEQGTESHQDKMDNIGKSVSHLSTLLESLTKICAEHSKQMSVPVPSNNSEQLKIEEVKDDVQGKNNVSSTTLPSYYVTMPEDKIEDKKENKTEEKQETSVENKKEDSKTSELSLNPEISKKLMEFRTELEKIVSAFMQLEKEMNPPQPASEKPRPKL